MADMPFNAHTTSGLRGNYAAMRPDWTVDANTLPLAENDHAMWRTLYARQRALMDAYADQSVLNALQCMSMADGIPDFNRLNALLMETTQFTLVAVPGLIPGDIFFNHLAHRRFPVTCWIRQPHEMDYLVEPDIFHDIFGHVPLLLNPTFAHYMAAFGQKAQEAATWDAAHPVATVSASERLARLYWFTVEFGLVQSPFGVKAYGAGILSSFQETPYALDNTVARRLPFTALRAMQQQYRIDRLQTTYFVLNQYQDLFETVQHPFSPLWDALDTTADEPWVQSPNVHTNYSRSRN
jgi:phenylalanine-4-hydroxylase